jgi:hypothetical protein
MTSGRTTPRADIHCRGTSGPRKPQRHQSQRPVSRRLATARRFTSRSPLCRLAANRGQAFGGPTLVGHVAAPTSARN